MQSDAVTAVGLGHLNGGVTQAGAGTYAVLDPATEALIGVAPECSSEILDAAMAAAERAAPAWADDEVARRRCLLDAAYAVELASDVLTELLTAEQGKPLAEAALEVAAVAASLRWYADLETPAELVQDDERAQIELTRVPLGCVAAIVPWNYPLLLAAKSFVPALRAGNTVILKPSPHTPLSTLLLGEVLSGTIPAGVLNVVSGGDAVGARMTAHPAIQGVIFTGSVGAGMDVGAAAARGMKRVLLELGGNDAAIVLDDADVDAIAEELFWGAFRNNGQTCWAIKRLYVPRARRNEVVDRLADIARSVTVGNGRDPGVQLGPVNNAEQLGRVDRLVKSAVAAGARLVVGGRRRSPGWFLEPAVVADADHGMALVVEEQFGPALPILTYTRLDEAVRAANSTPFGLRGSVWTSDPDHGWDVATRLACGTAYVNSHSASSPDLPSPAFKASGIGVSKGRWSIEAVTNLQVRHLVRR